MRRLQWVRKKGGTLMAKRILGWVVCCLLLFLVFMEYGHTNIKSTIQGSGIVVMGKETH
jgi:hypothetical protein